MNAARCLLAGAFLLALAAPFAAQARAPSAASIESEIAATLLRVDSPSDIVREAAKLAALGPAAIEPLFERLLALHSSGEGPALGVAQSATVLAALARLPADDVLALLSRLARAEPTDPQRQMALDLLGRIGGRAEMNLALELGAPADPQFPPGAELRAALESALLGICEREHAAVRSLAGLFPRAAPAVQATIVAVVSRAGADEAGGLLAAQIGTSTPDADMLVLLELSQLESRGAGEDLLVVERVRGTLGHPDPRLALLACLALEKLRDHEAVPDLIVLLGNHDPNLQRRAHAALTSLTGLSMPCEEEPWIAWLDEGLAWWDERADACQQAIASGSAADAAAALREVAGQRLYVGKVVEMLALGLQRPEPDLIKSACRALGAIRERSARVALAPLVAHADPKVAERARAALQRLEQTEPRKERPNLPTLASRNRNP